MSTPLLAGGAGGPWIVERVRPVAAGRRFAVEVDGAVWVTVDALLASRHDLYAGRELDAAAVRAAEADADRSAAMERAGRLLAVRDRSRAEVRTRLARSGHAGAAVEAAVERLEASGFVNDDRFAERFAEGKVQSGWGRQRIEFELVHRHEVDRERVCEALDAACPADGEVERARALVARRHPTAVTGGAGGDGAPGLDRREGPDRGATERAARFLAARGFAAEAVWTALGGDPHG